MAEPFKMASTTWTKSIQNECSEDIDQDGDVDGLDLATFATQHFDENYVETFASEFGETECLE